MNNKSHRIEIYDPSDYDGPDPIRVNGKGIVYGPERTEYYLVEPETPLQINKHQVAQILLRPRYFEDKITRVENDACTVGIFCVAPGICLNPEDQVDMSMLEKWGAGKITPCKIK